MSHYRATPLDGPLARAWKFAKVASGPHEAPKIERPRAGDQASRAARGSSRRKAHPAAGVEKIARTSRLSRGDRQAASARAAVRAALGRARRSACVAALELGQGSTSRRRRRRAATRWRTRRAHIQSEGRADLLERTTCRYSTHDYARFHLLT